MISTGGGAPCFFDNMDFMNRTGKTVFLDVHPVNRYRLEVTRVGGSGYGYKIYERERLIIVQPFIPVVSGKRAFQSEQDARCIGNLVLERVKAGDEFAISKDDLDNLGVVY